MKLRFWVPRSAEPKWICRICGKPFYENERVAREKHAAECAAEHHAQLVQAYEEARPPSLFKPFDPEYAEWAKQHGRIG